MTYAVLKNVNGNFSIDSEWQDDTIGAIMQYHNVCRTLWSSSDVNSATVEIIEESGIILQGYKEVIRKSVNAN